MQTFFLKSVDRQQHHTLVPNIEIWGEGHRTKGYYTVPISVCKLISVACTTSLQKPKEIWGEGHRTKGYYTVPVSACKLISVACTTSLQKSTAGQR